MSPALAVYGMPGPVLLEVVSEAWAEAVARGPGWSMRVEAASPMAAYAELVSGLDGVVNGAAQPGYFYASPFAGPPAATGRLLCVAGESARSRCRCPICRLLCSAPLARCRCPDCRAI